MRETKPGGWLGGMEKESKEQRDPEREGDRGRQCEPGVEALMIMGESSGVLRMLHLGWVAVATRSSDLQHSGTSATASSVPHHRHPGTEIDATSEVPFKSWQIQRVFLAGTMSQRTCVCSLRGRA